MAIEKALKDKKPGQDLHHPFLFSCEGNEVLLDEKNPARNIFDQLLKDLKNGAGAEFYSSQPAFVFERLHAVCDRYLPGISAKIDTLVREIVKNAEKETITHLARKSGLISDKDEVAPLDFIRDVLTEKKMADDGAPLLYKNPEAYVGLQFSRDEENLYVRVTNEGEISTKAQQMIEKRIALGEQLAAFDLQQEFEMKGYDRTRQKIYDFFLSEYPEEELLSLWKEAMEQDFDSYWAESPYFMLIAAGQHSSFYPYFATAHTQLRITRKKRDKPGETRHSAGMGYIQCAFVMEANRSLYGTYGKVFTPRNENSRTVSGFKIGLPMAHILA